MPTIIFPPFMLLSLTWLSSDKKVWVNVTTYGFLINPIFINLV